MFWNHFLKETPFTHFSAEHWAPLALIALATFLIIHYARNKSESTQNKIGLILGIIPALCVITRMIIVSYEGNFTIQEELPFHLCRLCALMAPFVMWSRNRFWLGVFYFWILVGTMNANITPELSRGFPHYEYILYFLLHGVLNALPFYFIFVYGTRIKLKDMINVYWVTNIYAGLTLILNLTIGSNYFYTIEKPDIDSLLNILGPWPWYLLSGQLLVFAFFIIFYAPFYFINRRA